MGWDCGGFICWIGMTGIGLLEEDEGCVSCGEGCWTGNSAGLFEEEEGTWDMMGGLTTF